MRIAIFFEKDKLCHFNNKNGKMLIFDRKEEQVIGVETMELDTKTKNERLLMLKEKEVNEIYLSVADETLKRSLSKLDIEVKTASMLENDKLFNSLYIFT